MARTDPILTKLRKICLALPDSKETTTWNEPHFRVGERIFCGYGVEDGRNRVGFKLTYEHAEDAVEDPRFRPAKYVGHKGWVSMDTEGAIDWEQLKAMIVESYRLIAPKRTVAKLDAERGGSR